MEPVKDVFGKWLAEEIATLERLHPMYYTGHHAWENDKKDSDDEEDEKLGTVFSVAQLSLFMHLIYMAGIFTGLNAKKLGRLMSVLFKTKNRVTISPNSFTSKGYVPKPAALDAVGDYLMEMFNLVQKYRKKQGILPQQVRSRGAAEE